MNQATLVQSMGGSKSWQPWPTKTYRCYRNSIALLLKYTAFGTFMIPNHSYALIRSERQTCLWG